jgi:hypothetical protein
MAAALTVVIAVSVITFTFKIHALRNPCGDELWCEQVSRVFRIRQTAVGAVSVVFDTALCACLLRFTAASRL